MPPRRAQASWRRIRIADEREIASIFRSGRRLKSQDFTVVYRLTHAPTTRYGVLVSRRLGRAVARNRIKRRCREIVRQPDMQYGAYDILILPQRSALELSPALFRDRLRTMLNRLT